MSIERLNFPQFFITSATPCPYLEGKMERKVFTHLINADAVSLNNNLSQGGFRRSQNIAYRPSCENCNACVSVRVPVDKFKWSHSFKRILKRNRDLSVSWTNADANSEQFSLFREYITTRHGDGGMSQMNALDFSAMIDESFVDTRLVEYRLPNTSPDHAQDGEASTDGSSLAAVALTDILDDGLSMIYSFFDTALQKRSLGTFMVLNHILLAQKLALPHVYLGYWVKGSRKMDYKSRFLPQERLGIDGWVLAE